MWESNKGFRSSANFPGVTFYHIFINNTCPSKEKKHKNSNNFLYFTSMVFFMKIISTSYLILSDNNFNGLSLNQNNSCFAVSLDEEFMLIGLGIFHMTYLPELQSDLLEYSHLKIVLKLRALPHKAQGLLWRSKVWNIRVRGSWRTWVRMSIMDTIIFMTS